MAKKHDNRIAIALELLPGLLFQWFGWGHIYAGRIGTGLTYMFGFWFLQSLNLFLMPLWLVWITAPLLTLVAVALTTTSVLDEKNLLSSR